MPSNLQQTCNSLISSMMFWVLCFQCSPSSSGSRSWYPLAAPFIEKGKMKMLHRSAPPPQGLASENCWRSSRTMADNSAGKQWNTGGLKLTLTISNILGAPMTWNADPCPEKSSLTTWCRATENFSGMLLYGGISCSKSRASSTMLASLGCRVKPQACAKASTKWIHDEHSGKTSNKYGIDLIGSYRHGKLY